MTGFLFFVLAVGLIGGVGLFLHRALSASGSVSGTISKTEFVVGTLLASLVIVPLVSWGGASIAKNSSTQYNEYWSGLEKTADVKTVRCEKDGSCHHSYRCDSYRVLVTKTRQVPYTTTESYTDSQGRMSTRTVTKYRTETYQEWETHWHQCPYVTHEYSYKVTDTLEQRFDFGSHRFPENAEAKRWKGNGHNQPEWGWSMPKLPKNVKQGVPADWQAVRDRLNAGNPGCTTKRASYKNYILANQDDIYGKASSSIEGYRKAKLLPKVVDRIEGRYSANKVYFLGGLKPQDAKKWQFELQRFNGHLGKERQGDLHLVVVPTSKVSAGEKEDYVAALEAYWQSEDLGRNTLSKNGIAVVAGVDKLSGKVTWVRGFTGMPMGNENLVQDLTNILNVDFTPEALLSLKDGALAKSVLSEEVGFQRVEMKNYEYLYRSIEIGVGARIVILLVTILLAALMWWALLAVDLRWHPLESFKLSRKSAVDEFADDWSGEDSIDNPKWGRRSNSEDNFL